MARSSISMSDECDVCDGSGEYPIIDRYGVERYSIKCPECEGSGETLSTRDRLRRAHQDRVHYEQAMKETKQEIKQEE